MPGLTKPCTIRLAISWWWLLAITLRSSSVTLWRSIALGRSIARGWAIVRRRLSVPSVSHSLWSVTVVSWRLLSSPVRYAKFESIRYFIDIDILQNCLIDIDIDIDIFQNHHIDIDIDIFGIALSISISIFSTSPYRYRYQYRYFLKVSIYRQSIFPIDILTRRRSKKNVFYRCTWGRSNKMCFTGAKKRFF